LDFESATINYAFTNFGGGATTKVLTTNRGINAVPTRFKEMVKVTGRVYGGSVITLAAQ
jgi:hypothetical protein